MTDIHSIIADGAGYTAGGFGLALAFSKLRAVFANDSASVAVSTAQQAIIEQLQKENTRLHNSIIELQQQVVALQTLVAELSSKITRSEITEEQKQTIDRLGREGKIERRSREFEK
jgi:peptidoglycan hydrolase CwlO-like protein